jgi:hypothetical protein
MSDKPGQEKIIDAEVEPLAKPRSAFSRLLLYGLGAVVLSVAIAVGWQLVSTGRLDDLLAGRSAPPQQQQAARPAAPATVSPAPAPVPAPSVAAPSAAVDPRVDALEQRLAALTASLERLQQLPASNVTDPARLHELEQQQSALRQAQEATAAQRAALQGQVSDLQAKLNDLAEARNTALRDLVREPVLQLIVWTELRDHARRGAGFAREAVQLGQYAETQGGNLKTAFSALQPFAEAGTATDAALAARYPALAEQQRSQPVAAAAATAEEKSWWQRSLDKITGLVSVRRVGSPDSTTVDGRLDIAQAALAEGDLAAAVAALDGLTLTPPLQAWREQAQARLKLDAALDAYGAALRGHLAVR